MFGLMPKHIMENPNELFGQPIHNSGSVVKNLPEMQGTQVRSLGQEDLLEKGLATHSSTLARRIPWTEELGRLQSMGLKRVGHDCVTNTFTFLSIYNL